MHRRAQTGSDGSVREDAVRGVGESQVLWGLGLVYWAWDWCTGAWVLYWGLGAVLGHGVLPVLGMLYYPS